MRYSVIAIEREYASGGREIGEQTAEILGIPCYNSQVLQMAAQKLGKSPDYVREMDETAPNSLLYSLSVMAKPISFDGSRVDTANSLHAAEAKVVWNLAQEGPCVIIGRCAGVILKDRRDVLRVFIHAAPEFRAKRAQEEYGIPEREIAQTLRRFDRKRAGYYSFFSTQRWDDRSGYDLMLDSSKLGLESSAKLLAFLARG